MRRANIRFRLSKQVILGSVIPLLLLSLGAYSALGGSSTGSVRSHGAAFSQIGASPIGGDVVSSSEARSRVDYSIPILPGNLLADPCGGPAQAIAVQEVWASETTLDRPSRQVA